MSDIKLSVIIPAYNSMYYIERCLNSILVQTLAEIEIIVVDDCSNDETPKILEEYKKKDARINILTLSENMGQGYARNKGIEIAKGEYIGFVESKVNLESIPSHLRAEDCSLDNFPDDVRGAIRTIDKEGIISFLASDNKSLINKMVDYTSNTLDIFVIGDIDNEKVDKLRKTIIQRARKV